MDSTAASIALPAVVGTVMLGLGLSLTVDDFRGVARIPGPVALVLACQLLVLPAACFGLVVALDVEPAIGIGMMVLAASPGGTAASLFSHLFRGDVALNVSVTAINSVLAIATLPVVANLAIGWYELDESLTVQVGKLVEVVLVVLGPVALGMTIRARSEAFARRLDRPVRIAAAVLVVLTVTGILVAEGSTLDDQLADAGLVASIFCCLSLVVGYLVARVMGLTERQSIACSFEVGLHNATLAIYVGAEVLGDPAIAVPPAVYGLVMFVLATGWGGVLTRRRRAGSPPAVPAV